MKKKYMMAACACMSCILLGSLIGQARKEKLMEFCDKFAQEIKIALPRMSKKYKDFYQYFLDDKKRNGVKFPVVP